MSEDLEQKIPKKRKPSFFFAITSIAMILFIIGLFGCGVLFVDKKIDLIKESVEIDLQIHKKWQ
jgi:cell division protein FtsX